MCSKTFIVHPSHEFSGHELMVQLVCLVCLVDLVDLVCLVHRVGLVQPNKQDKPNKPNNSLHLLADFFSIRLERERLTLFEDLQPGDM